MTSSASPADCGPPPPWRRAQGSPRGSLRTVGIASGGLENDPEARERIRAFRDSLAERGWIEGRDVRFEYRWMGGDAARARALAAELVALAPDVILSTSTVATVAIHEATKTIPTVFVNVADPVAGGFVASLARPGGNMTGFTPFEYPIAGKWLELLKTVASALSRVALMGDPNNHNYRGFWPPFADAAKRLAVEPVQLAAGSKAEIEQGIASLAAGLAAGWW